MAVEHKDDTQPISSKLKALQEAESLESHENNGKSPTDSNKESHDENNNSTHNHDNHDNHSNGNGNNKTNDEDTENTQHDETQHDDEGDEGDNSSLSQSQGGDAEQPVLEAGMEQLGIAEPSNFSVKHPLQNSWTIWYDNPGKRSNLASWGDHLKKITTFGTVEDFWRVFNNLKPASTLAQGSNYHIFKEHIEPKWEDPINSKGGKWTVAVPPKSRLGSLDQMWLYTILACIGETFLSPEDVCGMVVSVRKAGDRVQIWTRDATNETACRDIGRSLKEAVELNANTIIGYQSHADSMKKATKNRYEV